MLGRTRPPRQAQPKAGDASPRLPCSPNPLWDAAAAAVPVGGGLPGEEREVGRQNYRGEGSRRIGSEPPRSSSSSLFNSGKFSASEESKCCSALPPPAGFQSSLLTAGHHAAGPAPPGPGAHPCPLHAPSLGIEYPQTSSVRKANGEKGHYYGTGESIGGERRGRSESFVADVPTLQTPPGCEKINKSYRLRRASLLT